MCLMNFKWEFSRHDSNNNDILDDNEVDALLKVIHTEPCGFGFIRSCALVDGKPGIDQEEWNICFNLAGKSHNNVMMKR